MLYYSKKEELEAIYDKRKSFYKKAVVEFEENRNDVGSVSRAWKLYSYGTLVCTIFNHTYCEKLYKIHVDDDLLTQTTLRHIREFLLQHFYRENRKLTKKDILTNSDKVYNSETKEMKPWTKDNY